MNRHASCQVPGGRSPPTLQLSRTGAGSQCCFRINSQTQVSKPTFGSTEECVSLWVPVWAGLLLNCGWIQVTGPLQALQSAGLPPGGPQMGISPSRSLVGQVHSQTVGGRTCSEVSGPLQICSQTEVSGPSLGTHMEVSPTQSLGRQDWQQYGLELGHEPFQGLQPGPRLVGLLPKTQVGLTTAESLGR